jgi:glycosyltransferase involved in cell wall biosynthesis
MRTSSTPPSVTVTIPTYNRSHLVGDAIRSVLDQSLTDIEVFVSDNASTDDTAAVVTSFGDPRLRYTRNETNLGHLANLSRGLRLGTAPFVAILPDDDLMLPGSLERRVRLLEQHPSVGVVHSASLLRHMGQNNQIFGEQEFYTGGKVDSIEAGSDVVRKLLTDSYWINFPAAVIRRAVVGDVRFHEADGLADDLGVFLRIAHRSESIAYLAEPLVAIRMHSDASSTVRGFHELEEGAYTSTFSASANKRRARERFLEEHGDELVGVRQIRASSRRQSRRELIGVVKRKSLPDRSPGRVLRVLGEAVLVEPRILFAPEAARFVLGSLAGHRGRQLVHLVNQRAASRTR